MAEQTINVTKNSAYCNKVIIGTLLTCACPITYGYTSLNPLTLLLENLFNNTYYERSGQYFAPYYQTTIISLAVSMVVVGGLIGSLTVTYFLRVLTRKQAMVLVNLLHITGCLTISVGTGLTGSYEAFIVGRFIAGISNGLALNSFPVIIAESCVRKSRPKFQSAIGLCLSVGVVLGPVIGHPKVLGTPHLWPGVVAAPCLLSLAFLLFTPWYPETPYMLLRRKRRNEALVTLRKLRAGSQEDVERELEDMEKEQSGFSERINCDRNDIGLSNPKYLEIATILKSSLYRRQLYTAVVLYGGSMLTGINHAVFYSNEIFRLSGFSETAVTYVTIAVFTIQVFASLSGIKLIARWGGRKHILITMGVIIFSHIITTVGLTTSDIYFGSKYVSVVGILIFLVSYSAGPNVAIFALAGDITIEPTRQTVLKYSGGFMWLMSWLTGFMAPYMNASLHGYSFLVWSTSTSIVWALIHQLVPQTKGRTVMEIQDELAGKHK